MAEDKEVEAPISLEVTPTKSNRDLLILLIKDLGIHDGNWVLSAKLAFNAINFCTLDDKSDTSPAGVVALSGVRLERVPSPLSFSVNAAEVNPKKSRKK